MSGRGYLWLAVAILFGMVVQLNWRQVKADRDRAEVRGKCERMVEYVRYKSVATMEDRNLDTYRLLAAIGEVYGIETEDDAIRFLYWTMSITNGMTFAERRQRVRWGLSGKDGER